eukprot:PhF_6_TR42859/c0_g1_i1/m.64920
MLTENLILQKSKQTDLRHVKKLNVCSIDLVDIDILRYCTNLEVCSLSVNRVENLQPLSHCSLLSELYLRKNNISDLNQILNLSHLRHLKYLWLAENPISSKRNYRSFVIRACPYLLKLDDMTVTEEERRESSTSTSPPNHSSHMSPPRISVRPKQQTQAQDIVKNHPRASVIPSNDQYSWDDVPVGSKPSGPSGRQSHRPPIQAPAFQVERETFAERPPIRHIDPVPGRKVVHSPPPVAERIVSPPRRPVAQPQPSSVSTTTTNISGPREEGVFRAVLLLLNELSPAALEEVKMYIHEKERMKR